MSHAELFLKKHEDKRLRKGHVWIFSNEIDTQRSTLESFTKGQLVNVLTHEGKSMGTAYFNPNTLIAARLLSRKSDLKCGLKFFIARLTSALLLRERIFPQPYYRLVFGESDGLPGLVIDRFGSVLSVQVTTAGMEHLKVFLLQALVELLQPSAVIFKNDNSQRELEGLSLESELAYGELPETLIIEENNARFNVDILSGQKTGWFFDHRESRQRLSMMAAHQRVLDLFCYSGAWGIPAALQGAKEVVCVDASESAIELARNNACLNNVQHKMQFERSDVFEFLKEARANNEHYDIVVLDPPALVKRKKDFKQGYEAYRRLNDLALQVLAPNGILVSASCSYHLTPENLHEILRASARHIDRHMTFFHQGGQGSDHPVHPGVDETHYLKTFFCSVGSSL